jgi:hypothetical protein
MMHEWTDGCSAQYKSRHCMGDIAQSSSDFGYVTIRNYFETSHAKGPQDGAGANLKHKADMAVIKRQVYLDLKFYTHAYFSVGFCSESYV